MADVPVIVRDGLTFGFRYPYINDQTGRFVREPDLGDAIVEMITNRDRYSPRAWVKANMNAERATTVLEEHLEKAAVESREPWTAGLVAKTSGLHAQYYLNPEDRARFASDYVFLASAVRTQGSGARAG